MVELDADLIAEGEALNLSGQIEFVGGDATDPDVYRAVAPADIMLMCGMLGLIEHAELPNIVKTMQAPCRSGGSIVWTGCLDWREGSEQINTLRTLRARARFRVARYNTTSWRLPFFNAAKPRFAVVTRQFNGPAAELPDTGRLFAISSAPIER